MDGWRNGTTMDGCEDAFRETETCIGYCQAHTQSPLSFLISYHSTVLLRQNLNIILLLSMCRLVYEYDL